MEEKILTDQTTKSFFVKISQVDRIFNSNRDLGLFLWRATRTDSNIANPLFPDFHPREIRPGQFREPDVTIKSVSGVDHIFPVVHKSGPNSIWKAQGTSLFNEENTFPGKKWEYFEIPKGTKIPNGILIIKDDYNSRFKATHYSIVPDYVMSVKSFKRLLEQLLVNINIQRGVRIHG
jgi:hypothetical protein